MSWWTSPSPNPFGFLTPDDIPSGVFCRTLGVPNNPTWNALVDGALTPLLEPEAWTQQGALTPEECAERWRTMMYDSWTGAPDCVMVETPFWDDATDVDDSAPEDSQVWYGEVDDPTVAPTELTFREHAEIWTFAGLLAIAGTPGAAIAFLTLAPRFVLAFKQGDIGKVIRVFIDASEAGKITDDGSGDIAEMTIVGNPDLDTHQLYITVGDA